jgi:hypothetical protein
VHPRIALAVALVAAPAPFKVAVTMQATVATTLQASQTHIDPGTATCGYADVNGNAQRTIQFATPTPIVLTMSQLTHPKAGRLMPGFTASSVATAAFTETFTSPCANNTCTSLSYGWFSDMFPSRTPVPCDRPLAADESGCSTDQVPIEVRNVYEENHDAFFTKFNAGELDVGVQLEAHHPSTQCTAWWPFFHGFGQNLTMTPAQLERRLAHGRALVIHGSDEHFFPGDEGNVVQDSAWTFRLVRAR